METLLEKKIDEALKRSEKYSEMEYSRSEKGIFLLGFVAGMHYERGIKRS